jgi:hypothetical protein
LILLTFSGGGTRDAAFFYCFLEALRDSEVSLVAVCVSLTGCSSMKAAPSEGAGFVPIKEMSARGNLPFHKVSIKAGADFKRYRTLYIKDVNTQYLLEAGWRR